LILASLRDSGSSILRVICRCNPFIRGQLSCHLDVSCGSVDLVSIRGYSTPIQAEIPHGGVAMKFSIIRKFEPVLGCLLISTPVQILAQNGALLSPQPRTLLN